MIPGGTLAANSSSSGWQDMLSTSELPGKAQTEKGRVEWYGLICYFSWLSSGQYGEVY